MKGILLFTIIFLWALPVFAEYKYNALEGKWEIVPEDAKLRYNAMENEWSYTTPEADLEYNAMEDEWEWNDERDNYEDR